MIEHHGGKPDHEIVTPKESAINSKYWFIALTPEEGGSIAGSTTILSVCRAIPFNLKINGQEG